MTDKWPQVSIVILNWNNADDTLKCLDSFLRLNYSNFELIVVDNGSSDDSLQQIKNKFPSVTCVEVGKNLGYSGGNNVGIKYSMKDKKNEYILIINNDIELMNPKFLTQMIEEMRTDSKIGIIGPRVINPGGRVQNTILFTPTLLNCIKESLGLRFRTKEQKDYNILQQVGAVSGVCWMIRTNVVRKVGLLDEDYFMYAEEQDYCYRVKKADWKVMYYPIDSVLHKKEHQDTNMERAYRQYIYTRRNLVLFLRKHFGFWQAALLAILFLISSAVKIVIGRLTSRGRSFYNTQLLSKLFSEIKWALTKPKQAKGVTW